MDKHADIKKTMPWWLKILLLLILGLPGISGWPTGLFVRHLYETGLFTQQIAYICVWGIYACCVWMAVLLSAGKNKLLIYLGGAFTLALTVAILGALMRGFFPILAAGMSKEAISFKLIRIFINIIIFLPYSVLFINSFSAKKLIDNVARLGGKYRIVGLHLALAFRVFQHTGEVVFNLFEIWTEEYPEKILPRNKSGLGVRWYSPVKIMVWFIGSIHAWIFACIIHTFEPIPAMVEEVERINRAKNS
ncbi:MAG: hypothetical protein B6I22_12425 [Desulfobacteraceae bacterium 4572_123]|nr:MAG: hypothetical protein B6I22_12425 [Desulfobacteraceae bacterium 4572_123]